MEKDNRTMDGIISNNG